MKKIFLFELKRSWVAVSIFVAIMTCFAFLRTTTFLRISYTSEVISLFAFFVFGISMIVLFNSFSYNKKRISSDLYYGLPVTKKQLFLGKYLAAMFLIFVSCIFFMLICFLVIAISNGYIKKKQNYRELISYLYFFKVCLIRFMVIIPLFNILLLFYYKANTVLDGLVYLLFCLLILGVIPSVLSSWIWGIFEKDPHFIDLIPVSWYLGSTLENFFFNTYYTRFGYNIVIFVLYIIIGYALILYLIHDSSNDSGVRTQAISNGWFGYKVFIPLSALICAFSIPFSSIGLFELFSIGIASFIGYCIYHRSIKFSKNSYIMFGVIMGITVILTLISLAL